MTDQLHSYLFYSAFARIVNSGQSRSVILWGNIYDHFWSGSAYVPLISFLCEKAKSDNLIRLVYELNGPLRIAEEDREQLCRAWIEWKAGTDHDTLVLRDLKSRKPQAERLRAQFDGYFHKAIGNSTQALEFMRQLTICSRSRLRKDLLILIEAADMLLPAGSGDVSGLSDRQVRRISIVQDWFNEPSFVHGGDTVCLVAESRSLVHARVGRLPQVVDVEVPSPSRADRLHYIERHCETAAARRSVRESATQKSAAGAPSLWAGTTELAAMCAGLSTHAIRHILTAAAYTGETVTPAHVVSKVEEFIKAQIGDDVVEFKRPSHRLDDLIGFSRLKKFIRGQLIPRFLATGDRALPGAAIAGPIGGGKTFIFEAVAAELDMPVLVLKSIRSQWFGQTDVIFERIRRALEALEKVVIFVDEADTQFGRVDATAHATERRLTGKIQAMMSDPRLRGRVLWLLMTARIHLLSPDIRRPGRVGDLIIPVLDPTGDDRRAFVDWVLDAYGDGDPADAPDEALAELLDREVLAPDASAAAFAALRSQIAAERPRNREALLATIHDQLPPAIGPTRRYQTLQAPLNCTRRSLLPEADLPAGGREEWEREIRELEQRGVS